MQLQFVTHWMLCRSNPKANVNTGKSRVVHLFCKNPAKETGNWRIKKTEKIRYGSSEQKHPVFSIGSVTGQDVLEFAK